jgi:drug/metabolite transporter (DMT)-like permease
MGKYKGQICLLLAAIIWGSAFIFQKMGMDHIGPFTFGIFRFTLGSLALLPVIWIYGSINKRRPFEEKVYITPWKDKELLLGGLLCGLASFLFDLKLLPVKKIIGSYLGMGFLILFLIAWMIFNAAMRSGKKDYFSPKPL